MTERLSATFERLTTSRTESRPRDANRARAVFDNDNVSFTVPGAVIVLRAPRSTVEAPARMAETRTIPAVLVLTANVTLPVAANRRRSAALTTNGDRLGTTSSVPRSFVPPDGGPDSPGTSPGRP